MTREWRMVPFDGRFAAEFGEWPESGPLDAAACRAIEFVVARDRQDAEGIIEKLNGLAMEPPCAVGVVGRVGDGVAWLSPTDTSGRDWLIEWSGPPARSRS